MNRLMAGLSEIPELKIYGITDPDCFGWRCPTLAVRVFNQIADQTPLALATKLGDRGFFTWDGNYYALNLTERLDVEKSGGFLAHWPCPLQHGQRKWIGCWGLCGRL